MKTKKPVKKAPKRKPKKASPLDNLRVEVMLLARSIHHLQRGLQVQVGDSAVEGMKAALKDACEALVSENSKVDLLHKELTGTFNVAVQALNDSYAAIKREYASLNRFANDEMMPALMRQIATGWESFSNKAKSQSAASIKALVHEEVERYGLEKLIREEVVQAVRESLRAVSAPPAEGDQ